jgi:hypothetical protein
VPLIVFAFLLVPLSVRADRIVLRNLKIITDRTVVSFDEDGLRLDDGSTVRLDEIEKATVAADKQAALDKLVAEVGTHLYRIRQRMTTGDYEGLLPHAEAIYSRFEPRRSDTAYMVAQALMWGRLAAGRREAALVPYIHCFEYLRRINDRAKVTLPGERRLRFDTQTGLSSDLMPVWFDRQAAREQLPQVYQRIAAMAKPRPDGIYLYYVTLAVTAGDDESADKVLQVIQSDTPTVGELKSIVEAQREIEARRPNVGVGKLAASLDGISPGNRPLALYWLGLADLNQADREQSQRGMLQLLRIPAMHGQEAPELAAAALFRVMERLSLERDPRPSIAVRRELLDRFGQTYFAARVRRGTEKQTPVQETP